MNFFLKGLRHFFAVLLMAVYLSCKQLIYCIICLFSYEKACAWLFQNLSHIAHRCLIFIQHILRISVDVSCMKIKKKPNCRYMVVANHQSIMDILAAYRLFGKIAPLRFVAKKSLKYGIPLISVINRVSRNALIDRNSGVNAIKIIQRLTQLVRKTNSLLLVFPEGTRSKTGNIQEFKTSAVRTCLADGPMSMIVIAIDGGFFFPKFTILPRTKNKRYFYAKPLTVFENVTKQNAKEYLQKAHDLIEDYIIKQRKKNNVQYPLVDR